MLTKYHAPFFTILITLLIALTLSHSLPPLASVLALVFAVVLIFYNSLLKANKPLGVYTAWLAAIILGITLGLYRPSGFSYPLVFSVSQFYEGGLPFSLYINTAKILAGYTIIYFLLSNTTPRYVFVHSRLRQYALAIAISLAITLLAYAQLNLQLHLKTLHYIFMFAMVNLLATCVTEEAFMRLLLQAQIQTFLVGKIQNRFWLEVTPLAITTLIFTATHFTHSLNTLLVFTLAGFGYGLTYSLTKNLYACILVHFMVNILHFSLLTYPLA